MKGEDGVFFSVHGVFFSVTHLEGVYFSVGGVNNSVDCVFSSVDGVFFFGGWCILERWFVGQVGERGFGRAGKCRLKLTLPQEETAFHEDTCERPRV